MLLDFSPSGLYNGGVIAKVMMKDCDGESRLFQKAQRAGEGGSLAQVGTEPKITPEFPAEGFSRLRRFSHVIGNSY